MSNQNNISEMLKKNKKDLSFRMPTKVQTNLLSSLRKMERRSRFWPSSLQSLAASFIFGIIAASIWYTQVSKISSQNELLTQEIVSSHVRSMMVTHFSDVVSTDQHTVKPWFEGKLDFSPMVKDLAQRDFPLIGGRLDYIGSRPVAALNYKHNKHLINVFEWPADTPGDTIPQLITLRGYQLYRWTQNGMNYWVISDLNAPELQVFVGLLDQG